MGPLILDASVLIALLDTQDAHHERAVADVEAAATRQALLISASALSEALVAPARLGRAGEAVAALDAMGCAVVPVSQEIAVLAATLRAEHPGVRLPDALVVATARQFDGRFLTYDKRLARFA